MNSFQSWGEAITMSLLDLWARFVDFLPSLIGALVVFLFGLAVAVVLGKATERIVGVMKVDQIVDKIKAAEKLKRAGLEIRISRIFGILVKWFLVLVFLMAATDILKLNQVTSFLNDVILYLPNVVVAVVVLSIAFILGNFVHQIVKGSTQAAGVARANLLAAISKWAIIIFGLLAALIQLGIAVSLVNTIFIGLVAALALASGLAFGLGGRDEAAAIIRSLREEIKNNQ